MIAQFEITSGNLSLSAANPARFPYVVVSGEGRTRNLQSQHRQLETALIAAQGFVAKTSRNTCVVDRRTAEVWPHALVMGYNRK